ncbi:hypothetical protein Z043_116098 [Scleropages formosus]|uniref:Uncharacterized protein n=1 Tax=Scleropages formosus TaxID=113540 RepID=A0A0P7WP56_SCLFO|nr:hypothetical protein Z043_116098 [Scleropages formosus]
MVQEGRKTGDEKPAAEASSRKLPANRSVDAAGDVVAPERPLSAARTGPRARSASASSSALRPRRRVPGHRAAARNGGRRRSEEPDDLRSIIVLRLSSGAFSKGNMHGHGVYSWVDGIRYEGQFIFNVPMGHGTYTWPDGSFYEGEVVSGIRHGVGTYRCGTKDVFYRGQWQRGKRQGKGIIYYNKEMTSWYEGDWVNNIKDGWGVRCYPSGNVYEGQWRNNARHGEGTMKWLALGQRYAGQWEEGVQQGRGTHAWFLRRVPGSQYALRNEYAGDFAQGVRHGQGRFCYASGAVYSGGWRSDKKHGQMEFAVLRHIAELRTAYNFYSSLGNEESPDNTFLLTRLQLWRLLKDCQVQRHGITLVRVDRLLQGKCATLANCGFYPDYGLTVGPSYSVLSPRDVRCGVLPCFSSEEGSPEEVHSPFGTLLFRRFLSCLVILAYRIYHRDVQSCNNVLVGCFSKIMRNNILPNATNVKGVFFSHPVRTAVAANYVKRCWEIYKALCRLHSDPPRDRTMTMRHFVWMLKDLDLFDNELTIGKVVEILCFESPAMEEVSLCSLDLEANELPGVLRGLAMLRRGEDQFSRDPS